MSTNLKDFEIKLDTNNKKDIWKIPKYWKMKLHISN